MDEGCFYIDCYFFWNSAFKMVSGNSRYENLPIKIKAKSLMIGKVVKKTMVMNKKVQIGSAKTATSLCPG